MSISGDTADSIVLEISNVAHGGVFVARHEGRVVFVPDTMPGETVRARITDDSKKSFWRAETLEVLTPAPERVPHIWSAAAIDRAPDERAGGAEFGHIALPHQRELKRRVLVDALQRFGGIERDVEVEAVPGDDEANGLGYRSRVSLHVDEEGRVGPFAARSHRVVPVDDLPLATSAVQQAAPLGTPMPGLERVDVIAPSVGATRVVGTDPDGRRCAGEPLVERVGTREFQVAEEGFWQVHRHAADVLTRAVQDILVDDEFDPQAFNLDLYGGVGLFAAALGDKFGRTTRITTVESETTATDWAAENLAEWVGAQAITDRVDRYLQRLVRSVGASERRRLQAATIVLDPPRSGAGKNVVSALVDLHPAQIVYVACDPVALARDLGSFRDAGYELDRLRAFDLFPHTHHLESVALLRPTNR